MVQEITDVLADLSNAISEWESACDSMNSAAASAAESASEAQGYYSDAEDWRRRAEESLETLRSLAEDIPGESGLNEPAMAHLRAIAALVRQAAETMPLGEIPGAAAATNGHPTDPRLTCELIPNTSDITFGHLSMGTVVKLQGQDYRRQVCAKEDGAYLTVRLDGSNATWWYGADGYSYVIEAFSPGTFPVPFTTTQQNHNENPPF